jgi:hypothetical protein
LAVDQLGELFTPIERVIGRRVHVILLLSGLAELFVFILREHLRMKEIA